MGIERVTHYVDNVLTQAEARMGLRNTRLLVAWYTNQKNDQSVVHSHPYHELVLPIGGSTVRYSIDGSVYLVHVGELIYFPAQIYHSGIFNIDNDHSDRLVIQIDDALWQACRRNANLKNAAWMHSITVLDPDVCSLPLEPQLPTHLALVWKKHAVFSRAAERFYEMLKNGVLSEQESGLEAKAERTE